MFVRSTSHNYFHLAIYFAPIKSHICIYRERGEKEKRIKEKTSLSQLLNRRWTPPVAGSPLHPIGSPPNVVTLPPPSSMWAHPTTPSSRCSPHVGWLGHVLTRPHRVRPDSPPPPAHIFWKDFPFSFSHFPCSQIHIHMCFDILCTNNDSSIF
jgi:hypothetical protein